MNIASIPRIQSVINYYVNAVLISYCQAETSPVLLFTSSTLKSIHLLDKINDHSQYVSSELPLFSSPENSIPESESGFVPSQKSNEITKGLLHILRFQLSGFSWIIYITIL